LVLRILRGGGLDLWLLLHAREHQTSETSKQALLDHQVDFRAVGNRQD
jgi:hypothetical protein